MTHEERLNEYFENREKEYRKVTDQLIELYKENQACQDKEIKIYAELVNLLSDQVKLLKDYIAVLEGSPAVDQAG